MGETERGERRSKLSLNVCFLPYPLRNSRYATLLYGYNNTQAVIGCFLVMTGYFWISVQGSGQPDGHPFHGQLTVVKKGIRCPVPSGCIAGSRIQLIEVTCFFLKLSAVGFD